MATPEPQQVLRGGVQPRSSVTVSGVTVNSAGTTVRVDFSQTGLSGNVHENDWTVSVNGAVRTQGFISFDPANGWVRLNNISPAITSGQTVTVNYAYNSAHRVTHGTGVFQPFTRTATNNSAVQGTTPPPVSTSPPSKGGGGGGTVYPGPWITPKPQRVDVSASTVTVTMDKRVSLNTASYSASMMAGYFTVRFNGGIYDLTGASLDGYQIRLNLAKTAPRNAKISVHYTKGPLLDYAYPDNQVEGFGYYSSGTWISPKPNRVDISGKTVTVNMDKAVALASGYTQAQLAGQFTVRINGQRYTPTTASVADRNVTLTMGNDFPDTGEDDKKSVDYEKKGEDGPLLEAAYSANAVDGFGIYG